MSPGAGDPAREWRRTNPDIVVYRPRGGAAHDTDNEHFLVFESPDDDELLALWTQSSCEGHGDNRLMLARSPDGFEWSEPVRIAGTTPGTDERQASWGFPVVADTGRIYVLFTREVDRWDASRQGSGTMGCIVSDDAGRTWREAPDIPMPRTRWDHPDPAMPKNWIVWQKPVRDSAGRWLAGYTLVTSPARLEEPPVGWWHMDSRALFMRFENIHEGPAPEDLTITWLPEGDAALEVPIPVRPEWSTAQEPSVAVLPDGRLFTTMRTLTGHIWYSVSDDDGTNWREPEPLLRRDGGEPLEHPLSCCPIYLVDEGRYVLLLHNNTGRRPGHDQLEIEWTTNHLNRLRNPTFISLGTFTPDAHQPVSFGEPVKLLDTDDVPVGPKGTTEVATYASMTHRRGMRVLWYPDRKYYLLGRIITDELLASLPTGERHDGRRARLSARR